MSSTTDPTSPARIRQLSAQELKSMLDDRVPLELLDVRTEAERAIARIEGARHLDEAEVERLQGLDRGTLLVFHCHHGFRSQAAAQHFVAQGFTNVCNLSGGIDAWSAVIDPSVRRY
ncbi:MAG TPA: rhodanese-like domain-containing protein [Polyangia bacterium]|nr:rhodanese-like domain-containing protein [Polyangia bacterium]